MLVKTWSNYFDNRINRTIFQVSKYFFFFVFAFVLLVNLVQSVSLSCTKSDSDEMTRGNNLYTKGIVSLNGTDFDEFCYIGNNRDARLDKISECYGSKCLLREYFCPKIGSDPLPDSTSYPCPWGCKEGACLPKCTDSDKGRNYFTKGSTKGTWASYKESETLAVRSAEDHCSKDTEGSPYQEEYVNNLYEYYCTSDGYFNTESIRCEFGCSNGACLNSPATERPTTDESQQRELYIKEKVTCSFKGATSDVENSCSASGKNSECNGNVACLVDVKGVKGEQVEWKSSCGGYQYTTIDGADETVIFDCSSSTDNNLIKEKVTCYFKNSDSEQECYADDIEAKCKAVDQCSALLDIRAEVEKKQVTWKSTCGGYQYTIQDGRDEAVVFECGKGETNLNLITGGFKFANWQCYNGEKEKSGSESSCKPSGLWKKYAKEFCVNKCDSGGKCGVSSFSVGDSCYFDGEDVAEEQTSANLLPTENTFVLDKETLVCKDSCPLEGKCYQFGYRKSGDFCSDS